MRPKIQRTDNVERRQGIVVASRSWQSQTLEHRQSPQLAVYLYSVRTAGLSTTAASPGRGMMGMGRMVAAWTAVKPRWLPGGLCLCVSGRSAHWMHYRYKISPPPPSLPPVVQTFSLTVYLSGQRLNERCLDNPVNNTTGLSSHASWPMGHNPSKYKLRLLPCTVYISQTFCLSCYFMC